MNRNNIYTVNPLYNGQVTPQVEETTSGGTTIIYQQGGGGGGLTDAQKQKLDGIQEGAEVNQNAYSKVRLNNNDALILEATSKTATLNLSGVYPVQVAINQAGGLDFTVSSDSTNNTAVVTQKQLADALAKIEEDKYWKLDADGKLYTELDVYSQKEVSAYGSGPGGGGTGGASALYECVDVLRDGDKVQGAAVGSILSYNGSHWYAIPQSAITPDLTNYATKSYVTEQINDLIGGAPGTLDTLKEIAEALGNDPNFAATMTDMINKIGLRVTDLEARMASFDDMFEWDKSASASDASLWRIKAKKDLYGVGEISAYGYSSGTVPTGAQYMYELKDVLFTELTSGQLLQWNGTKWINIDKNAVGLNESELAKYLTTNNYAKKTDITWANLLNKPSTWAWADITGKPTTLAGYGITDGVPNTRRVSAGSGLSGGGALSSDVTISLGTIGTAGTYTKVTTDMYGRVVSGTTLSEGDIPTLQISKISGLQTALDSKLNISDFSTWFTINKNASGQVISIQANFDFFGVGEISAYGLGETQPSVTTLAGLDDVTITSPANGQTLIYDSATSQWKNGTIIGGGNISLNGTVYSPVDGTITLPVASNSLAFNEGIVYAKSDGITEIGNKLDFHDPATTNQDYDYRLHQVYDNGAVLIGSGKFRATGFQIPSGTSSQFLKADGSVDGVEYYSSNLPGLQYSQIIVNDQDISMYPTGSRSVDIGGSTSHLITFRTQYGISARTVQFYTSYGTSSMNWRVGTDNRINNTWATFIDTRNYINYIKNDFVLKAGDTMTGTLTAPTLWSTSTLRSNLLLTVGSANSIVATPRAELHITTPSDNPCDLWLGAGGNRRWSITARGSGEAYKLGIYNNITNHWNMLFENDQNSIVARTQITGVFLIKPDLANTYSEGIRITNASNNWSNIQFGAANAWSGNTNGQWTVGKNPANYFQICMSGTETANSVRPSKGFSIDTNGYIHTGYISVEINTDEQGNYFYASDDAFLRRTTWTAALSHLSNKQLTLDLTGLDQNKWYPCTTSAPAYNGIPLRITIFNGLRGDKPSWGSHQQGFSLLLDYYVTGSGWGTLGAVSKLNWYWGSYGGETAFGGRQQNTMGSAEIIYLRGGGKYYYRLTNGSSITVHPNGYSWANGSYTYSAPVKTSQDNSPMERTFDQVYWMPATLRETRTFWGRPFNGSQNVSGPLQGVTTIDASSTIYTGGDIAAYSRLFCGGRLYVDRNRYNPDGAPAISLAIGDTDTGLHWESDGLISLYANAMAVGNWNTEQFRYGHGYFKQATGNDYHTLGIMVNGNGTANTIKPGIGFHQPGVYANSLRSDGAGDFRFCVQGGSIGCTVQAATFYANGGWLYSNVNGCEVRIGSQNTGYVHITNNANRAYYMDHRLDISGHIIPYSHNAYNLGESGKRWNSIYAANNIYANGTIRSEGDNSIGLVVKGTESTQTIIYGQIGSAVNSVVSRYAVNWYNVWARFDVHRGGGTDILKFSWKYNDTELMYLGMGGYFQVNGNIVSSGEVTAYSDVRLKSNIQPLKYRGRLTPKTYIKDNKQSIGFIAQEVQMLYPETVLMSDDKEHYLSLNYNALTAVLAAQLNNVDDEVTLLKKRVEFLEKEVKRLSE